jgi:hypothetical protein
MVREIEPPLTTSVAAHTTAEKNKLVWRFTLKIIGIGYKAESVYDDNMATGRLKPAVVPIGFTQKT